MGNLVFRYFLMWLRQEMRDEAYHRIVTKAERRARRQKHQQELGLAQQKHQEKQQELGNTPSQQGWLSGVSSGFDDLWKTYIVGEESDSDATSQNREPPTSESDSTQQDWQFWELAKHEGDETYLKWTETHIWTYVGLSAPILGAVNPLRSVISGENMGLPFTDETAREMELSK